MNQLRPLQQSFMDAIIHDEKAFEEQIESTARVSASQRINIYHEAYRLRLLEALEENYLGLAYLLGDDQFATLGLQYLTKNPSSFASVRWFGDQLPKFVKNTAPWSSTAMLYEMAQLDWAMTLAFDATDQVSVGIETMAQFTPDQWPALKFHFHPSIQRLDFAYSVMPFRNAVEVELENTPAPEKSEYPMPWLIWRQEMRTLYRSMEVDEALAMDQARNQASFASLCEGLTEWIDPQHAPERIAGFLKKWLVDELIVEVTL
ncbi:MAG: hypothetical protein ACI8P9_002998 [Parasphingorhabdus sp.]|jgi:hypothetical protein